MSEKLDGVDLYCSNVSRMERVVRFLSGVFSRHAGTNLTSQILNIGPNTAKSYATDSKGKNSGKHNKSSDKIWERFSESRMEILQVFSEYTEEKYSPKR